MARYVDGFVIAVPKKKIVYRSKKQRNSVNARVMKDLRMNNPGLQKDMPFEMKRMAFGGFKTLVYW